METLQKTFNSFLDKGIDMLPTLVIALAIVIIGFWLIKVVVKLFLKTLTARKVDASVHVFLRTVVELVLKTMVLLTALSTLGVNVNSIVAALSAATITAGLGFKDCIAQIASGIQILLTKPFKNGDYIQVQSVVGVVDHIAIMNTTLHTVDNKLVVVPNMFITQNPITNYTAENIRRLDLEFQISYSDDIKKAKEILLQIGKECQYVIDSMDPIIGVKECAASAVVIDDKVWVNSDNYWDAYYDMQEKVKLAFDKEGISIPFTQMDIHVIGDKK